MKRLIFIVPAAALWMLTNPLFAQTENQPAASADTNTPVAAIGAQADSVTPAKVKTIQYFSLEHRTPDRMDPADRELLLARRKEISSEAEFYGYDLSTGEWITDQAVCPAFPDTVLLHYLNRFPDGSESLFTALVPRNRGRVRIVPVLHRNGAPFDPAVKSARNFALFNSLVPPDIARRDSNPEGKWLTLGVCYAEMVGGRPNVPDEPGLDVATIRAPVAIIQLDAAAKESKVQFSDRESATVYKIWTVSFNGDGRVTSAENEDYATYVARIAHPVEQTAKVTPPAAEPPVKITPPPPDSTYKIIRQATAPQMKTVPQQGGQPVQIQPAPNP